MKVTFDSNVWRWVVAPEDTPVHKDSPIYHEINRLCSNGLIEGYLSGSMFAWEAVTRLKRKDVLSKDCGNISLSELEEVGHCLHRRISFGSDPMAHPGTPQKFIYYLEKARGLGFKVMHIPRLGYLSNPNLTELDWADYDVLIGKRFADVVEIIESRGCGMAQLQSIGHHYATDLLKAMEIASASEIKAVANAVAEWADGDSVAIHLAYGNDFFCTKDNAKGAGQHSVMASKNVECLAKMFDLKKVSPEELVCAF
ncbi:MAG: hypothetical protein PHG00_02190 [Methylococcales bacterium]|nr:hypothetical protein [Methylococcales bacterium]